MARKEVNEDQALRSVAIQNATATLRVRQRAEEELVRAKEALQEQAQALALSLAQMHATLEATTDAILVVDHSRHVTHYNENFARLWEIPRAVMESGDLVQLRTHIGRHFADETRFYARVLEIYETAPAETFDVLELANGKVLERFSRMQFVDHRDVGRVWSFRDITAHRRSEEALRDETHVLELLNQTGIALAANLDLLAVVQTVTDASTEMSGAKYGSFFYTLQDETGEARTRYSVCGLSREAIEASARSGDATLFGLDFNGQAAIRIDDIAQDPPGGRTAPPYDKAPGQLAVRSYLAVPVMVRTGEVIGGLFFGHPEPGIFNARTEKMIFGIAAQAAVAIDNARLYEISRRAANEREALLESERAARSAAERMSEVKDEFLATLSHELRTPLSAILGWSQVLRRGSEDQVDFQRGIEAIERNARVQTKLIDDLLDMSRIAAGKVRLDIQPVEPAAFIEAAIETVRPAAAAKGIRIERLLDLAAGPVSGDPNRLQQVVWNLLSNAIKFTPKDGKVQISLERVNSHVEINVADTGIGIASEFLPHVFERFKQADSTTTRHYGGLGLGLSIVKQLAELHGGTVSAKSLGAGQGATFSIHLPVSVIHRKVYSDGRLHPATPGASTGFSTIDLSGLRIVVVDDEPDARELIKRILEECDAEVFIASTADEALTQIEAQRPDLLISDIGMPDVDGFELLRKVRALGAARGGRVPAIALTAFARSEDRTRALRAGFLVHVSKPVEPSELVATIASIAGRTGLY